ncbi:hypothetical protein JDY09_01870 [Thermoleophilum album]|uniref:hypothetical protein n=1 Tax=Thermoleophilum album TaxID=29539 RepID=UPI00237C8D86|nr:hypothetical protein [Thermoleophilum album]WDT94023.1 hypothetical protein JDY09_01870 [Thermoleophilum album]
MQILASTRRRPARGSGKRIGLGPAAFAALFVGGLAAWRLRRARRGELPAGSGTDAAAAPAAARPPQAPGEDREPEPTAAASTAQAADDTIGEREIEALRSELKAELDRLSAEAAPRDERGTEGATGG